MEIEGGRPSSERTTLLDVFTSALRDVQPRTERDVVECLNRLMLLRVVAISLLFGVAVSRVSGTAQSPTHPLYAITIGLYAVSLLYAALGERVRSARFFAYLQFVVDGLAISLVVTETGAAGSPFLFLYLFPIMGAAYVLILRGAMTIALLNSLALLGTIYGPHWWSGTSHGESLIVGIQLASAISGFFAVALLSGVMFARVQITDRRLARVGARLSRAGEHIEALRDLHGRIVEHVPAGLLIVEADGQISFANRAAGEILGREADDLPGQPLEHLMPMLAARVLTHGAFEDTLVRTDGNRRMLQFNSVQLPGPIPSRLIAMEDRTEIRALELKSQADERLAAVGRLSAGIAHEIRNPLASISGSLQLLEADHGPNHPNTPLIRIVSRETNRLNDLVGDFLSLTREPRLQRRTADLLAVLVESREMFMRRTGLPQLEIAVEGEAIEAWIDRDRIRQILLNLMLNASQAMPRGGTIRLTLAEDGGMARVRVADDGKGIPADQLERVFDPFHTTRTGGTGLGLAITRRLVRAHGGSIDVESVVGQGTVFTMSLPRNPEEAARHAEVT